MAKSYKSHKKIWGSSISTNTIIQAYFQTGSYVQGDIIDHPNFGKGSVEQSLGNKIEVRFEDKMRTLIIKNVIQD